MANRRSISLSTPTPSRNDHRVPTRQRALLAPSWLAGSLLLAASSAPLLAESAPGAKSEWTLFMESLKLSEEFALIHEGIDPDPGGQPSYDLASGFLSGAASAAAESGRVWGNAVGDPSICYHVEVVNASADPDDPLFPEPSAVFFTVDLPLQSVGAHELSVDLEITLEDANGDGIAFVRPAQPSGPLHRAHSFAGTTCCASTADVLGTIEQPGTYQFETTASGSALADGQLSLVMNVDVSPEDRVIARGRVIQDDGSGVPACEIPDPTKCLAGSNDLCLQQERFAVDVHGFSHDGEFFRGQTVPGGSADTGLFWFFDPDNWELMTKVLDGCSINGYYWVLQAAVTDVFFETEVYDIATGRSKKYSNRSGQAAPATIDTTAFPCSGGAVAATPREAVVAPAAATRLAPLPVRTAAAAADEAVAPARGADFATATEASSASACAPGSTQLCLSGDRFRVEVDWRSQSASGAAQVAPLGSDDSGVFYFFDPNNWEMLLKVLDTCAINGHRWVFAAATTDVEYTLRVTDTVTGETKEYFNPLGERSPAITDTTAFLCQ